MSELIPTNITADRETARLTITWNDGRICEYPFDLLRNACPCAQCRGGHENMRPEPDADVFSIPLMDAGATRMRNLKAVGNYAISIEWEDGHTHGIYNWHYLRVLCESMQEHQQ
jgi:DUF971 family protein